MPACKFTQAHFSHIFESDAAYGYCAAKKEHYYGFKGLIVTNSTGVIAGATRQQILMNVMYALK